MTAIARVSPIFDDGAVSLTNDCVYGLTTSGIRTADFDTAEAIGARVGTGAVHMNRRGHLYPAPGRPGLTRPSSRNLRKI